MAKKLTALVKKHPYVSLGLVSIGTYYWYQSLPFYSPYLTEDESRRRENAVARRRQANPNPDSARMTFSVDKEGNIFRTTETRKFNIH